jgi:crossover junction endodeoxyribonuclease RuvC
MMRSRTSIRTPNSTRVLAIDPGYERMGTAVLEKVPGSSKETLVYSNCFKTAPSLPHHQRLLLIGEEIVRIISEFAPAALAIETLFFSTNRKTAMHVSEARGVMLFAAASKGLEVCELNPLEIKTSVTGYGKSGKEEVTKMVRLLVKINKDIRYDDEYDAIAVGIAYYANLTSRGLEKLGR